MTRHFPPHRLLVAVSVALLVACGKQEPPDTTPTPSPIAAEKFAEEYAQALCKRSEQCGALAPYLVDACKGEANGRMRPEDVTKAIAAGRLTYDADKARQCIEGIQKTRCLQEDFDDDVLATCYAALQGTVRKGGECSFLYECAMGSCGGTAENTCPATCPTDVKGEGEDCSLIQGVKCDVRAGLRCSNNTCVKPAGAGASCVDNLGCASGFVCVQQKCTALGKEGAGCAEDASCAAGFYCQESHCTARKREGQPCSVGPEEIDPALRLAQCQDGLVCRGGGLDYEGNPFAGTCAKVSAEGGPCTAPPQNAQDFATGCQTGLSCVNGACVLPPTSGECPEIGCRRGVAYCDRDTNTCQLLRPEGADCTIPPQCASRICGDDGKCGTDRNYCHE